MLMWVGILVAVAVVVVVAVTFFRMLMTVGTGIAGVLVLVALGMYFLPDLVGPFAGGVLELVVTIWEGVEGILPIG